MSSSPKKIWVDSHGIKYIRADVVEDLLNALREISWKIGRAHV